MLPNIILLGFMGCGKTSVGRHVAALTGHRFVDTDDLVVREAGCSIPEIFSRDGEAVFRDWETKVLRELVGICGIVLATGGGIILREENRELLPRIGVPIWLDAHPDSLFERVSRNQRRPLLATENPRATFDALLESRRPIYAATTVGRVDSTHFTHEQTARAVLEAVRRATQTS